MSIPNTLTIYINTRIPGFQKLKYRPSMTVSTASNETVYFDPLVKLTKSIIQSVPLNPNEKKEKKEKQVASQFFNRGMFETMVNRSLSSLFSAQLLDKEGDTLNTKLKKAVDNNVINQNISLTLETLFKPDSIITIGGKPYTIYSYHWDNGDWKVDTKLYTLNNSVYNASPFGRTQPIIIQNFMGPRAPNDYSRAQGEMKLLDKEVLEGEEFNKKGYVNQPLVESGKKTTSSVGEAMEKKEKGLVGESIKKEKEKEKEKENNGSFGELIKKKDDSLGLPIKQEDQKKSFSPDFTKSLFKKKEPVLQTQETLAVNKAKDDEDEPIKEDPNSLFVENPNVKKPLLLPQESVKESKKETRNYNKKNTKKWVEDYMNNNNYTVKDNEAGGDCFFAVIRDAFASIGKQTTVEKLRELVSKEATEELFNQYKGIYEMANNLLNQQEEDLAIYENNPDMDESDKETIRELKREIPRTKMLRNEFSFMENVKDLSELREKMKTCEFWADTWAMSTMERILKVKFILLSSEAYKSDDKNNVIQCGQMNDPILEQECEFNPDYYIVTEYTGDHYMLIGYKGTEIFTFPEIPYDLKELVTRKCIEKNSGLFSLIPEFQKFRDDKLGFKGKKEYNLRNIKGGFGKDETDDKEETKEKETPLPVAEKTNIKVDGAVPVYEGIPVREQPINVQQAVPMDEPVATVVPSGVPIQRGIVEKQEEPKKKEVVPEPESKTPSAPTMPIQKHINSLFFNDSKLGYFIVIDLELYPGTSIPLTERPSLACQLQRERINQSLAELRGTVYKPSPKNDLYTYNPPVSKSQNRSPNRTTSPNRYASPNRTPDRYASPNRYTSPNRYASPNRTPNRSPNRYTNRTPNRTVKRGGVKRKRTLKKKSRNNKNKTKKHKRSKQKTKTKKQ